MASFISLSAPILIQNSNNKLLTQNYLYGPHEGTIDTVKSSFEEQGIESLPAGTTIGIIENNTIVEYWNPATKNITNFVKKTGAGTPATVTVKNGTTSDITFTFN